MTRKRAEERNRGHLQDGACGFAVLVVATAFAGAIEDIDVPIDPELSGFSDDNAKDRFKHDYFTMLRSAAGGGMMVMGVTGIGSLMLPAAAAAVFTTVMPFVAVPAFVALAGGAIKGARSSQLKTAQQQLRVQLAEQLQKVRRHFFDVHLTAGSSIRRRAGRKACRIDAESYVKGTNGGL